MSSMIDAIKATLITKIKIATAAYFPANPTDMAAEYVGDRFDDGTPTAMSGQWYCAVHAVSSRDTTNFAGNSYVQEEWSAAITVTVRSAYAADSRIEDPMTLYNGIVRAVACYIRDNPWDIMAAINTLFAIDYPLTNGLTIPFKVREPLAARQKRLPEFMKAVTSKKTSQISAFSGTIRLSDAIQKQPLGNLA